MVKNGNVKRRSVVTTLPAKTYRAIISGCISCLVTVLCLIPTMTSAPSSTSVGRSPVGLIARADYTQYQTIGRAERTSIVAGQMSTVNDWRQYMRSFAVPNSNVDYSSYRVSYSATDNYGTNFDIWFTMYVRGGDNDGAILYNSGWLNGSQSDVPFPASLARGTYVDVYFRIRYPDGVGVNPPTNSDFSRVTFLVTYDERIENVIPSQTTALPPSWTADTTVSAVTTVTVPEVSTLATTDISSQYDAYSPINLLWFENQLAIFGIVTGWITSDLPWVMLLICWFLICSIVYWMLK